MNPAIKLTRGQILRLLDGYPVQIPTEVGMLEFAAVADLAWMPMTRVNMAGIVAAHERVGLPPPKEVWSNGTYEVFVQEDRHTQVTHLSIKRLDRAAIHNWRHLQQIKNEICGEFREGLELYPGEHRIADNANQFHVWVLPEGDQVPLGFPSGMVMIEPDEVQRYNRNGDNGRQEPMQPGLTIGLGMAAAKGGALNAEDEAVRQRILNGTLSD